MFLGGNTWILPSALTVGLYISPFKSPSGTPFLEASRHRRVYRAYGHWSTRPGTAGKHPKIVLLPAKLRCDDGVYYVTRGTNISHLDFLEPYLT